MLADRPTLWPPTLFALALVLCGSLWQQIPPHIPDWIALIAFYALFPLGLLWFLSWIGYLLCAIGYYKAMWEIGRPDVRLAEYNTELARQIRGMSAMQMSHHLQVLNALQLPTQFQPNDIISIGGRDVQISSVLEYIKGMEPDGPMPPVRNYTKEPARTDIRHLAKTIENSYAVESASNRSSVKTTK